MRFRRPAHGLRRPRDKLLTSAERKGPEKMAEYRVLKNTQSIDGLPGLDPANQEG